MQLLIIKLLGWVVAHTPESLLRILSATLGDTVFYGYRSRRRLMLSNLHHAFPDRPESWHRQVGRESCRRMIETGLLSLATPFLSEARIRRMARLAPSAANFARDVVDRPHPVVLATLHLALWESQTWLKLLSPVPLPDFGIIFRPLDNPAADAFVKSTRERFGMRLLSRKEGFADALKILRNRGCVGILFDQNAGNQGALTLLLGRVCSSTELPGLLAAKYAAEVRTFYPRRTGFWRVEFESDPISHDGTTEGITVALNRWLEATLTADENVCSSWLWVHDRWRNQDVPARRLRLEGKRDILGIDMIERRMAALPRRTRIWVRLPNWLGDVVMAVPILRAIRASRPDAEVTVVARRQFVPLLEAWGVADKYHALPARGGDYWRHFWQLRKEYVDVWILFTNSFRGDLEAKLAKARQRFGIHRAGKPRPLLTHAFEMPSDFDEQRQHQIELWRRYAEAFGMKGSLNFRCVNRVPDAAPVAERASDPVAERVSVSSLGRGELIGLIVGSENTPAKRWPVAHWRALIAARPDCHFVLLGTANDEPIAAEIAQGFPPDRIQNLCGRTTLQEFAAKLTELRLLVTNDTGGMHLANALGVPLVALFGPTNPIRTGPIFASQARILQPPGCPPHGGGDLAQLQPEIVAAEVGALLGAASRR